MTPSSPSPESSRSGRRQGRTSSGRSSSNHGSKPSRPARSGSGRGNTTRTYRSTSQPKPRTTQTSNTSQGRGASNERTGDADSQKSQRPSRRNHRHNNKRNTTSGRRHTNRNQQKGGGGNGKPKNNLPRPKRTGGNSRRLARLKPVIQNRPPTDRQMEAMRQIPPLADGDVRFVPVCGVEWITTNMSFVEYKDEIVVIDAGFGFGDKSTPGVNYTIPDVTYLEQNKHKIKGLVITHGHLDHVGGIPYVIEKLGFPPIYALPFGAIFIKKKLEEFPQIAKKVEIVEVDQASEYLPLSDHLKVKFFGLTHSIPDSSGVIVQTPLGGIVSTGDVRVENTDGVPTDEEIEKYSFFKDENILLLTIDSTNIEKPGWSMSERKVYENIDKIIGNANGRLFIAAFSSQVERLMQFMQSAKKYGKYVAFEGRSIKSNMAIAEHLKLTDFGHVVPIKEIDNYPPNKVVVLLTGSQGEQFAALNRVANGTHRDVRLNQSDTIVLSASVVPGNEYPVAQLKNFLFRNSYNVITYRDNLVHASGHGNREELKWVNNQIPSKFFMPIHGEPYMVRMHAAMAEKELGIPAQNIIVPDNGTIVEFRDGGKSMVKLNQRTPHEVTVVDGTYIGPLHQVVMDDRLKLHDHGMFVVVVSLNVRTGKLKKSPDIISRGFVYLRESKELLNGVRGVVKRHTETYLAQHKQVDFDDLKKSIGQKVEKYLLQKTHKEPIVIPVVLGV